MSSRVWARWPVRRSMWATMRTPFCSLGRGKEWPQCPLCPWQGCVEGDAASSTWETRSFKSSILVNAAPPSRCGSGLGATNPPLLKALRPPPPQRTPGQPRCGGCRAGMLTRTLQQQSAKHPNPSCHLRATVKAAGPWDIHTPPGGCCWGLTPTHGVWGISSTEHLHPLPVALTSPSSRL